MSHLERYCVFGWHVWFGLKSLGISFTIFLQFRQFVERSLKQKQENSAVLCFMNKGTVVLNKQERQLMQGLKTSNIKEQVMT